MPAVLTWLVGLLLLVVESVFLEHFGITGFCFQTALVLTVFVALKRTFVAGGLILAGLLIPMEWMAGGPGGFYSLGIVGVFFLTRLARGGVQGDWGVPHVLAVGAGSLIQLIIMASALVLFSPDSPILTAMVWSSGSVVLGAALSAWPIGALLNSLDKALDPRRGDGRLQLD